MDLDIRKNVYQSIKDDSMTNIVKLINESISIENELALPGLGVLLELAWKNLNKEEKENFSNSIIKELQKIYF